MNPKSKALELWAGFIIETIGLPTIKNSQAKKCALFCCDQIIDAIEPSDHEGNKLIFWNEVKNEIHQL